jgi:HNH endonuclease
MSLAAMRRVFSNSQSEGSARLVLLCIADYTDDQQPDVMLTVATMMRVTGLGERTVRRAVGQLEDLGELHVQAQPGKPNRQTVTVAGPGDPTPDLYLPDAGLHNRRRVIRSQSRRIWDRDGWTCQVGGPGCTGHKYLTVGHIIPIESEGSDDDDNVQSECLTCNVSRGPR